jgi:hypothetical protein
MQHNRKSRARQKMVEPLPLPESLERAFSEIERPMARYADSTTETRAVARRMAQDGR